MKTNQTKEVNEMLKCPIEGCKDRSKKTPTFSRRDNLKRHLKNIHGLFDSEIEALMPSRIVVPRREISDDELDEKMKRLLKSSKTAEELSSKLDIGINRVRESVARLQETGLIVDILDNQIKLGVDIEPPKPTTIPMDIYNGTWVQFTVVSDTHLNSKYERMDVLRHAYEISALEGIKVVLHVGNIVDGFSARINQYDVFNIGVDEQLAYLVEAYPQVEGITTHFITGQCHEGWWVKREHIKVGEMIEDKARRADRDDLVWEGHIQNDILIPVGSKPTRIRLFHPGGGSAYSLSYKPQKIIESLQGGDKPDVMLVGHYHKAGYFVNRNVHVLLAGCTQDQTPFMLTKQLAAHIGFWIVRMNIAPDGSVNRFSPEWVGYYDGKYYDEKNWNKTPDDKVVKDWKYVW